MMRAVDMNQFKWHKMWHCTYCHSVIGRL